MVDEKTIKHLLRSLEVSVSQTDGGDFIVNYNDIELILHRKDVEEYLKTKPDIECLVHPSLFYPGYYEHAVEVQGSFGMMIVPDFVVDLTDRTQNRRVILSPPSPMFILTQLDSDEIPATLRRSAHFGSRRLMSKYYVGDEADRKSITFDSLFSRILTIKVSTSSDDPWFRKHGRLRTIAEAALFHIAYSRGLGFSLSLSWERVSHRLGFRNDSEIQFPTRTYNHELLAYYHLAFGSNSLMLAYLALYKILEFLFTSSSEKVLHQKITERLVQPDFSHTKANKLRDLVRVVKQHDTRLDERRLLRIVLEHYFDIEEVRNWILDFDNNNNRYLTTDREVFAEIQRVDTSNENLFASIANRIYHIRNALVHHKEGEVARFIPFSGQESVLYREIPLLLYLAEQVIIKTGKDLS